MQSASFRSAHFRGSVQFAYAAQCWRKLGLGRPSAIEAYLGRLFTAFRKPHPPMRRWQSLFRHVPLDELQGSGIHAVAQARGLRAVREDVAEMGVALAAE